MAGTAEVCGIGYLRGTEVNVRFLPADAGAGIRFVRTDLPGRPSVPALVEFVEARERRTTIRRGEAVVEMVEHVMAALAGLRIDNCTVEIDAFETPGMDGSSAPFVEAIASAGAIEQDRPRGVLTIDRPVSVREGRASVAAFPGAPGRLVLSYQLDYGEGAPIPSQSHFVEIGPERFRDEIAPSRTFLLDEEAEALRKAGIGGRTSLADLLVFGPGGPIGNTLRFPDECARHKLLDVIGDLALIGKDLEGHVVAHRSGHALNVELARALLVADAERATPAPEVKNGSAPTPLAATMPHMDIAAIMELMPHRYPFLLLDRVLTIDPGRSLRALKNVTCNEPFFPGHWPGRPVMPGVLILEAMAQAAGILISQRYDLDRHMVVIASIDDARLRRQVVPGDQLLLEIDRFRARSKMAEAYGVARIGDQVAAEARLRFAVVPSDRRAA